MMSRPNEEAPSRDPRDGSSTRARALRPRGRGIAAAFETGALQSEQLEPAAVVEGDPAGVSGAVREASEPRQRDRDSAQRREHVRRVVGTDLVAALVERHVTHVVAPVLDPPVPTHLGGEGVRPGEQAGYFAQVVGRLECADQLITKGAAPSGNGRLPAVVDEASSSAAVAGVGVELGRVRVLVARAELAGWVREDVNYVDRSTPERLQVSRKAPEGRAEHLGGQVRRVEGLQDAEPLVVLELPKAEASQRAAQAHGLLEAAQAESGGARTHQRTPLTAFFSGVVYDVAAEARPEPVLSIERLNEARLHRAATRIHDQRLWSHLRSCSKSQVSGGIRLISGKDFVPGSCWCPGSECQVNSPDGTGMTAAHKSVREVHNMVGRRRHDDTSSRCWNKKESSTRRVVNAGGQTGWLISA